MTVFVLGIDSAEPIQVFDQWLKELPNLKQLVESGSHGKIASTVPPITCPAWMTSLTGLNPGNFGLYDLRYIKKDYFEFGLVNSRLIRFKKVWDYLGEQNRRSITVMIPTTYPPQKINGIQIAGFLTPDPDSNFTWPPSIKEEIFSVIGGKENYIIDVYEYRRLDPHDLYKRLMRKLDHDFKIIKYLLSNHKWDFFMSVIMSIDRAQHTLWKFFDKDHPRYIEDPELEDGLLNIYRRIDEYLGTILDMLPEDTNIIVVSDHGAKRMYARINANEVLIQEGFLKLNKQPKRPISLKEAYENGFIDMKNSDAFALGAYVAQIFINTEKKPLGKVSEEEYLSVRTQIADVFREVRGENGEKLDNRIIFKEDAYRGQMLDVMPDITVYFDNLHYGSNEMIGFGGLYSLETAKGADDSNHGEYGIFIISGPNIGRRVLRNIKLEDLAPTILDLMDIRPPSNLDGNSILG